MLAWAYARARTYEEVARAAREDDPPRPRPRIEFLSDDTRIAVGARALDGLGAYDVVVLRAADGEEAVAYYGDGEVPCEGVAREMQRAGEGAGVRAMGGASVRAMATRECVRGWEGTQGVGGKGSERELGGKGRGRGGRAAPTCATLRVLDTTRVRAAHARAGNALAACVHTQTYTHVRRHAAAHSGAITRTRAPPTRRSAATASPMRTAAAPIALLAAHLPAMSLTKSVCTTTSHPHGLMGKRACSNRPRA